MIKQKVILFLKGFCMGIADLIPGVSGGTIAFLVGIYEELIASVASFDGRFAGHLFRGKIKEAFAGTGWQFLAVLLAGILTAIFSLSKLLTWLLTHRTVYVHAFFFGLIVATVFVIAKKVEKKDFVKTTVFLISACAMFFLVGMIPVKTPDAWWFLMISGGVAICAMILPGISGAFILLLLGKYEHIIAAVSERHFDILIFVAFGCLFGLIAFVRLLRWLLAHYYDLTLSVLAGLVLGSLRKIWPWKETLSMMVTPKGKVIPLEQINIFPQAFSPEVLWVIILIVAGVILSLGLAVLDEKN
ncbi:MAG TPA: DUF368 domain-containing protein [Candidatus Omnitrophota bacterium]|nr:DUF368 domain-containing protein [Candidatus Omnitrophota bacterium]